MAGVSAAPVTLLAPLPLPPRLRRSRLSRPHTSPATQVPTQCHTPHPQDPTSDALVPARRLVLKLEGHPALQLPLPASRLCLAPLARAGGKAPGGRGAGAVQFEPLLLVQAARCWDLAAPPAGPVLSRPLTLHVVYTEACSDGSSPPAVLGVGALVLPPPAPEEPSGGHPGSRRGEPSCGSGPLAGEQERGLDPIQCEAVQCCRLLRPGSGEEAGSITLAVRLARVAPAQVLPSPQSPAKPAAAEAPAGARASPAKQPCTEPRSKGVQAGPAGAAGRIMRAEQVGPPPSSRQPSAEPVAQPLPAWPSPGVAAFGLPWQGPLQSQPLLPACWPLGGGLLCPSPPLFCPTPHGSGAPALGIPAAALAVQPSPAPQLQGVRADLSLGASSREAASHTPAAPADPLAARLAAVRSKVQQATPASSANQQRPCSAPAQRGSLCRLRSPLEAAPGPSPPLAPPPLQHHLREHSPSRRRWAGISVTVHAQLKNC